MSDIALYNLLRRIPDATDEEVERAVSDVASAKEATTKSDIAEVKTELKYLRWFVALGFSVTITILIAILKFL